MAKYHLFAASALSIAFSGSSPALAQAIQNGPIPTQTVIFDNTITSNGGTVQLDTLSNLANGNTWARTGFTITSTDGSNRFLDTGYLPVTTNAAGAAIGGESIGINPNSPFPSSGLTFTFANPINAFGLEIGDWATCCFPSSLFIAFDGGATRLVATANSGTDNPGFAAGNGYRNFVGAFDSSNTFSTVTFFGDGAGEYLVAGGTIRYGAVDIGSVPDTAVPEPSTWAMMLLGFGFVGGAMRTAKRKRNFSPSYA
ncbi:PEPxxWA-CTERM sorting domain-containing protein [Erythrobacter sp. QSSC1-22B]|uniref:PEPxxWA-CTERM sorting domain-containing protein n=1 Tax=Erythrobacter sp. QSSC1-22B TaxID=1860125 RepID=UPI000A615A27|nr:PEPxxWA-CTERM sorting domain-containing protein [Erythrobacter sp. QSSC1-22B]